MESNFSPAPRHKGLFTVSRLKNIIQLFTVSRLKDIIQVCNRVSLHTTCLVADPKGITGLEGTRRCVANKVDLISGPLLASLLMASLRMAVLVMALTPPLRMTVRTRRGSF